MAKSGLTTITQAKNTVEVARVATAVASNKNSNNPAGLTVNTQAINATEIARGNAALTSNQG